MDTIFDEIERCRDAGMWYAALILALTIPDICASLDAGNNARSDGVKARYIRWCKRHLAKYAYDGAILYDLRSGVVHQGRFKSLSYDRVVFSTGAPHFHHVTFEQPGEIILAYDVSRFCQDLITAAREWYEDSKELPDVKANAERLVRPRPDGLQAFFPKSDFPIIA